MTSSLDFGTYLSIPLSERRFVLGQVVYWVPTLDVPIVAFYRTNGSVGELPTRMKTRKRDLIIFSGVVPDLIRGSEWAVLGCSIDAIDEDLARMLLPLAVRKFVGLSILSAGMAITLLESAFESALAQQFSEPLKATVRKHLDAPFSHLSCPLTASYVQDNDAPPV